MQNSRVGSTLELVVNEQQMQNMSQIDLSRSNQSLNQNGSSNQENATTGFTFADVKQWPARFGHSLAAKWDEAQARSETKGQFVLEVLRAFSGLAIWLGCFICTIIIPVLLLFIGLLNLDNCTESPSLPYYVFTIGFVMTASNLFNLALAIDLPILANHRLLANDIKNIIASILNIIFNVVVAFYYILTAYKVFALANQTKRQVSLDTDSAEPTQLECDSTLYNFTFWFVCLSLGSFAVISLLGLVLHLYNSHRLAIIRGSTPRSHARQGDLAAAAVANQQPNISPAAT